MLKYSTKEEIREIIEWCCNQCNVPELAPKIRFEFNNRFTNRMGDAIYHPLSGTGRVRFSRPLWPRALEEKRRNTIIHETCHVIANYKYGGNQGHNYLWKSTMIDCGEEPKRCYDSNEVDRTGLRRTRKKAEKKDCVCGCGVRKIGPTKYKRMLNGVAKYRCNACLVVIKPL